jgi:hypothetical protein
MAGSRPHRAKIMPEPARSPGQFSDRHRYYLYIMRTSPENLLQILPPWYCLQPCGDDSVPSLTVKVSMKTYEDHGGSILTEKFRFGLQAIGQNPYIQGHSFRAFGSHLIGDRAVTAKRAAHRTFF